MDMMRSSAGGREPHAPLDGALDRSRGQGDPKEWAPPTDLVIEVEHVQHQLYSVGTAKRPPRFVATFVLHDTQARMLSFMEDMSHEGTLPNTSDGPRIRDDTYISNQVEA
ncbi:hypothetical protein R3W88_001190 [Solanum pinnatisectum]|uniref:Uncharacterized protein n=1 Tax=Solanum pinnatisectum TaxID=50273 RepID=A0AAV9MI33_9SOLN|nr:hypothetical protein R3W88_001190 [Solanum pinnatisectum]